MSRRGSTGLRVRTGALLAAACVAAAIAAGCEPETARPTGGAAAPAGTPEPPALAPGEFALEVGAGGLVLRAREAPLAEVLESLAIRTGVDVEIGDDARARTLDGTIRADSVSAALPLLLRGLAYRAEFAPLGAVSPLVRLEVGAAAGVVAEPEAATAPGSGPLAAEPDEDDEEDSVDLDPSELEALQALPLAELIDRVERGSRDERLRAIAALEPEGRGLDALVDVLERDGDPRVRAAAAAQLEDATTFAGVSALLRGLQDSDPRVVRASIQALEFAGDESTVRSLRPLLTHPDPRVRAAAADAIEFLED